MRRTALHLRLLMLLVVCCGPASAHEPTWKLFQQVRGEKPVVVAGPVCELTIELVDEASGEPMPGLLRVTDAAGNIVQSPDLLNRGLKLPPSHGARQWMVLPARQVVRLPQATLTIEAIHGIETQMARETVDLTGKATASLTVKLRRLDDGLRERGWIAGNTHLHLRQMSRAQAEAYLRQVCAADALEVVFVSHLQRAGSDLDYISNSFTADDLRKLGGAATAFGHGQEYRHNFGPGGEGYGHVLMLNLHKLVAPSSVGVLSGEMDDGTPLRPGWNSGGGAGRPSSGATTSWALRTRRASSPGSCTRRTSSTAATRAATRTRSTATSTSA